MVGVCVFRDGLLNFWIHGFNEYRVSNSLFRLNVRHIDQMNTQVWLLNLLVCLANSMQFLQFQLKHLLKCLTFCLFPLLTRIAELQNVPCQNRGIGNYSTFTPVKVMSFCTYFQVKPNENSSSCDVHFVVNQSNHEVVKFVHLCRRWKRNPGQTTLWPATGIPWKYLMLMQVANCTACVQYLNAALWEKRDWSLHHIWPSSIISLFKNLILNLNVPFYLLVQNQRIRGALFSLLMHWRWNWILNHF